MNGTGSQRIEWMLEALNISEAYPPETPELDQVLFDFFARLFGRERADQERKEPFSPKRYIRSWDGYLKDEFQKQQSTLAEIKSVIDRMTGRYTRLWMLLYLIDLAVKQKDIEYAKALVAELPEADGGPCRYAGYRCLLKHYAAAGDLENFKGFLKLSAASKFPKTEIQECKSLFLKAYSQANGWRQALGIAKTNIFGERFFEFVLYPETERASFEEMGKIISENPAFSAGGINLKGRVMTNFIWSDHKKEHSRELFLQVLEVVKQIDKAERNDGVRLRDVLLMNLASATNDVDLVKQCKKFVTSPNIQSELNYHLKNIQG